MENDQLPMFRRFIWYGAYGEGYALYCESLGQKLGIYTDPYQQMGALGNEIHRASRLGDSFILSDFHEELLKDGCMPLDLLEKKMDEWANKLQRQRVIID